MDFKEINTENLDPKLRRAVETLIEIGKLAEEAGTDDIDIDLGTLEFLQEMLPQVEALINTQH